tara:strand:- start:5369 stop:5737 length:369 start_codon:yes stop_codon:yes gene_type:complete
MKKFYLILQNIFSLPLWLRFLMTFVTAIMGIAWGSVQNMDWQALAAIEPYSGMDLISTEIINSLPDTSQSLLFVANAQSYEQALAYVMRWEQQGIYYSYAFIICFAYFVISLILRPVKKRNR